MTTLESGVADAVAQLRHLRSRPPWWALLLIVLIGLVAVVALRRRYRSPISDIPGPFIATVSGILWHCVHTLKGHLEEEIVWLHKKHGTGVPPFSSGLASASPLCPTPPPTSTSCPANPSVISAMQDPSYASATMKSVSTIPMLSTRCSFAGSARYAI